MPFKDDRRGVWRGQVKWQGRKFYADFPTKAEARTWEVKKREDLQREPEPTKTGMALLEFFNRYLDDARLRFVRNTFDNKKRVCARLLLFLEKNGVREVTEITSEHIHNYLSLQAEGGSNARYNEDYKHLRAMWTWGMNILDFPSNPLAKIKPLPHDRPAQYTPPTEDILRVIAACTREDRIFLNCYLDTGARRAEIFRWTWNEDINFERREVRLGTRKTRDGSMEYEWLPMNEELYQELWSWWKNRPVKDTPYVFASSSNRHYGESFKSRHQFMKGLCKRAGVKPFGFHALRRYVASFLADTHKLSAKTIQRILRHKHVMTTERYIKNINRDLRSKMELLGEKGLHEGPPKNGIVVGNGSNDQE